ncbi:hypothetical protein ABK040_013454 [Willaertia magna]
MNSSSVEKEAKYLLRQWMEKKPSTMLISNNNNNSSFLLDNSSSGSEINRTLNVTIGSKLIDNVNTINEQQQQLTRVDPVIDEIKKKKPSELSNWQKLRLSLEKKKKTQVPVVNALEQVPIKTNDIIVVDLPTTFPTIPLQNSPIILTNDNNNEISAGSSSATSINNSDSTEGQLLRIRAKLLGDDYVSIKETNEKKSKSKRDNNTKTTTKQQPNILETGNYTKIQRELFEAENEKRKVQTELQTLKFQIEQEKNRLKEVQDIKKQEIKSLKQNQQMKEELERLKLQQKKVLEEHEKERVKIFDKMLLEIEDTKRLSLLSKTFNVWVKKSRKRWQLMLKIKTKLEWKRKRKAFRALFLNAQEEKEVREKKRLERELMIEQKKLNAADHFFRTRSLSRYFVKWVCQYRIARDRKIIEKQHARRKKVMENFIEKIKQPEPPKEQKEHPVEVKVNPLDTTNKKISPQKVLVIPKERKRETQPKEKRIETNVQVVEDTVEGQQTGSPLVESTTDVSQSPKLTASLPTNNLNQSSQQNVESQSKTLTIRKLRSPTPPTFLKTMEERITERKERWKQLQEKYKQNEEEKERIRKEQEQKKLEEEQEKKKAIVEEKRKEKELAKLKILEKEKRQLELQQKLTMAQKHYERSLLKYLIWNPLMKIYQEAKLQEKTANRIYNISLLKKTLNILKFNVVEMKQLRKQENQKKIEQLIQKHERNCVLKAMKSLRINHKRMIDKYIEADYTYSHNSLKKHFSIWKKLQTRKKHQRILRKHENKQKANTYSTKFTKSFYFRRWRLNIQEQKEQRERERQQEQLKEKVKGWLEEYRFEFDDEF